VRLASRPGREHEVAGERTERGRRRTVAEVQLDLRLVDDDRGPRPAQRRAEPRPACLVEPAAGRVLEVDDQVREPRRGLAQRRLHGVEVPAVGGHRDRHGDRVRGPDRLDRVRVGRLLDQHPVAGPGQQPQRQRERVVRAVGDQHLVRRGRQTALGVPLRDPLAQLRQAVLVEAVPGQLAAEPGQHRLRRRGHAGDRGRDRAGEVDHPRRRVALVEDARARTGARHGGPRAGPAPADHQAVGA
jgi:hypothetical protein